MAHEEEIELGKEMALYANDPWRFQLEEIFAAKQLVPFRKLRPVTQCTWFRTRLNTSSIHSFQGTGQSPNGGL